MCTPGQGTLSPMPSLSDETLSRWFRVQGEGGTPYMHVKEPTSLLAKEQGETPMRWSDRQIYG